MRVATHPGVRVKAKARITSNGCHEFIGKLNKNGYGRTSVAQGGYSKEIMAHRAAWEHANNMPVPEGLFVLHKCDNRKCVNPEHLYVGTAQDNSTDMVTRNRQRKPKNDREFCAAGHALTPENRFDRKGKYGVKIGCRECQREGVRHYQARESGVPYLGHDYNGDKTHCKRGHEFTDENTYINPTSGGRQCRSCVAMTKGERAVWVPEIKRKKQPTIDDHTGMDR